MQVWVLLDTVELKRITRGLEPVQNLALYLAEKLDVQAKVLAQEDTDKHIAAAKKKTGEWLVVDSDTATSIKADGGTYVMAWIRVTGKEAGVTKT